ncbi:bifunctional riboflavin kinase/FAD synthetase [Mariniblastus fucicola]|uniref:Riboflavin biosynthesis protein n=1 Tax=Mariniblastus fucicola TaxID=980251 RepID=A0A5B9PFT9_9BACT|nr:bifunctional riboflavin kinase/FAD synthetase [Mariniblastus fucicola]QEG24439.1 Riboflavin kinase [Mariniblastus fucicola]
MKLYHSLDDFPISDRRSALTIGNFDGVHRGHCVVIDELKRLATKHDAMAVVFTFEPHPVRILKPEAAPPPLTWIDRKAKLLAELGVDAVIAYPTDLSLLSLTYQGFFDQIIKQKVNACAMVEGPNFHFGKGRAGTPEKLAGLCRDNDIELTILDPSIDGGEYISSSRIRNLVRDGNVDKAREMLTRPYRIRGMVTHGAARGRQIGFPTANVDAIDTLIPANGVYAGRATVDRKSHWAAIHIGPNPTFGDRMSKVEVHILDFDQSIYGMPIEVDFISRLRDICEFDSPEKLKSQLNNDIADARKILRTH